VNPASDLLDKRFATAAQRFEVDLKINRRIAVRFKPESIWYHLRFSFLFLWLQPDGCRPRPPLPTFGRFNLWSLFTLAGQEVNRSNVNFLLAQVGYIKHSLTLAVIFRIKRNEYDQI
jgi:hypothetical protein